MQELKKAIVQAIGNASTIKDKVDLINELRFCIHEVSPFKNEPVDFVKWVSGGNVVANDYNPNKVAPPEMQLLEVSITEDGYTQPIVTSANDTNFEVVDGFHRNRVGKESKVVNARVFGFLPVVEIRHENKGKDAGIASTIRHNRARGKHQVSAMSEIVLELKNRNWTNQRIARELGMDEDEILRLCQISGLESLFTDKDFSRAWISGDDGMVDDFEGIDDEVSEEEMLSARIPNEGDVNRIFHTHDKWELVEYGFFNSNHPRLSAEQCKYKYKEFLENLDLFKETLFELFEKCPNSCEHNLTNGSLNRIAWLGQAAVSFKHQIPSVFCSGFNLLSDQEQDAANRVAFEALNAWLEMHEMEPVPFETAYQSGRQVELY